jgi:hypothetical protein
VIGWLLGLAGVLVFVVVLVFLFFLVFGGGNCLSVLKMALSFTKITLNNTLSVTC